MLRKHGADLVHVREDGSVRLLNRRGDVFASRALLADLDKPIIEVKGWVDLCLRERGKKVPGSSRRGFNIWNNSGREYLALHMSYQGSGRLFRSDAMAYIGVGIGTQVEDVGVTGLVAPVIYAPGLYLAALNLPPTFPLTPTRTTVQYQRTFIESAITTSPGQTVLVSELGLFTDGHPEEGYVPGSMADYLNVGNNVPVAYKTFEPVGKTSALQLDVTWQIRF